MAMSVADYAYIMSKGTIVYESTPDELINNESVKSAVPRGRRRGRRVT